MRKNILLFFILFALSHPTQGVWTTLAPGMELGTFNPTRRIPAGDPQLQIVRIDPDLWDLELIGPSGTGESHAKTAKRWCEEHKLTAAINAGMYGTDYRTHVGYMRTISHVNSSHVNSYKSVAAFNPKQGKALPRFRIFDLDDPDVKMEVILRGYSSVIQNLRLIKRPGINRWRRQDKRWSEAALGEDRQGRALFIFSKTPTSMHEFNRDLLSLGIGLVAAQHLEGGARAQLYLSIGDVELELFGKPQTTLLKNDELVTHLPVPNIIGVRPR